MTIAALSHLDSAGDGVYRGGFDATWNQGRGCYGGMLAATIGQCLEREVPGRALRGLSIHLCAPAEPRPLVVRTRIEREGSAVTFASARIEQDGAAVVIASATLAKPRVADTDFDADPRPPAPPPETIPDLGTGPGVPAFTRHLEFRFVEGIPFTGADSARTGGWLRPRTPEPLTTALSLALLDAWPLAILPRFTRPRPAASIAIHFQLFPPTEAVAGAWFRCQVDSPTTRQGYSDQTNRVWGPDGRLIGRATQLVAVIR